MTEPSLFSHQITSPYSSAPSSASLCASSSFSSSPSALSALNTIIRNDPDSIPTNSNPTAGATTNAIVDASTTPPVPNDAATQTLTADAASKKRASTTSVKTGGSGGPPRKRTTRACDQCNQLRTKCDGRNPCAHCTEFSLECGYLRVPLKRGKASKTYIESTKEKKAALAAAMAVATAAKNNGEPIPPEVMMLLSKQKNNKFVASLTKTDGIKVQKDGTAGEKSTRKASNPALHDSTSKSLGLNGKHPATTDKDFHETSNTHLITPLFPSKHTNSSGNNNGAKTTALGNDTNDNGDTGSTSDSQRQDEFGIDPHGITFEDIVSPNTSWLLNLVSSSLDTHPTKPTFPETKLDDQSPPVFTNRPFSDSMVIGSTTNTHTTSHASVNVLTTDFRYQSTQSHAMLRNQSPGHSPHQHQPPSQHNQSEGVDPESLTRFPILNTIKHMLGRLPMPFIEHLLESYFSYSTHLLAHIVRKSSILSPTNPRKSSPALIFSCLLVAAHYSDNPLMSGSPSARENVIRRLTDLTISNLTTAHQVTPAAIIDDVIAYIHLGTMVSASEYKGLSLRFWSTAWALSKELKLGTECPDLPEEAREERRRTWWLLYIVDRHLGLCYNRPLAILDSESTSLYRPVDDAIWLSDQELTPAELDPTRIQGLCHHVTGQGLFGYFLPLMTILGSLLELHHLQQNPILPHDEINKIMRASIKSHLDQYVNSLKNWNTVPCANIYENAWRDYAYQISHVMHILSLISWDPLDLLNSIDDTLLNSPEFGEATLHAISAANHTRRILTMDADLMLMPFFFGIYLLQSSFVLLFLVDRVETKVAQDVVVACETVVHAHEVCVVTLNTEYQRNFRRVMRSTINILNMYRDSAVISGSGGNDDDASLGIPHGASDSPHLSPPLGMADLANTQFFEAQKTREKDLARKRRNDVLGLYRWSSGGHGLAV